MNGSYFLSEEGEELLAQRLEYAFLAQTLADPSMRSLGQSAPINPPPAYQHREAKLRNRIYHKIQRYLQENKEWDEKQAIEKIDDLAGGRFLVHYIDDAEKLHDYICSEIEKRNDINLINECRDCIHTPKQSGFRAITQDTNIQLQPDLWFPFEFQILTYLAHDWDKKQHTVYENREEMTASIGEAFSELSRTLYEVDNNYKVIRELVKGFMPQE